MEIEEINMMSNATIALSTFIGIGGATAYYLKQIQNVSTANIIMAEIIYILITALFLYWVRNNTKKEVKNK